jgi:glycosyltransferase involved in cell wall biosynthesis
MSVAHLPGAKDVWIVMPARNEELSIGSVIDSLHKEGWKKIIVVDDGSTDSTAKIASSKGALVIPHHRNLGLGAALRTGLQEARRRNAVCAVTFDADGQHDPKAVKELVKALDGADLVIGVRKSVGIPLNKRIGNFGLNLITYFMGGKFTDSQSGFRAFGPKALEKIKIRSHRYEVSSEIIIQAKRMGLRIKEVPVKCFYTKYSRARGTTIASGFRIFWGLLMHRLTGKFPVD